MRRLVPLPLAGFRGNFRYMTPSHGQIVKAELLDRRNRWGYYGLHGLDFAILYRNRPIWDIVAVGLLSGTAVLSATTLAPSFRRLKRHAVSGWRRVAGDR